MNDAEKQLTRLNACLENYKKGIIPELPKGYHPTSGTVYGYYVDPDSPCELKIDEEVRIYVRFIFEEYLRGSKMGDIAKILTNIDAPTPIQRKQALMHLEPATKLTDYWSRGTIRQILLSPYYIGFLPYVIRLQSPLENEFRYRGTGIYEEGKHLKSGVLIPYHHPAIIDLDTYTKALERLNAEYKPSKSLGIDTSFSPSILNGKFFCRNCGRAMQHHREKVGTNAYKSYYCCASINYHTVEPCPKEIYYTDDLVPLVKEALLAEHSLALKIVHMQQLKTECPEFIEFDTRLKNEVENVMATMSTKVPVAPAPDGYDLLQEKLIRLIHERQILLLTYGQKNYWVELFAQMPENFEMTSKLVSQYVERIMPRSDETLDITFKKERYKEKILFYTEPGNAWVIIDGGESPK